MQEKLLKQTAFFTAVFTVIAVGLMVWFQWNRDELLQLDMTMVRSERSVDYKEVVSVDTASGFIPLNIVETNQVNTVSVRFSKDIDEPVMIESDYVNRMIKLHFPQLTVRDLENSQVMVDHNIVNCEQICALQEMINGGSGVLLKLPVQGYFEGQLTQSGREVEIVFSPILPDKTTTVVLDASHGGNDSGDVYQGILEKELTLKIMNMVKEQLGKEDMRVFCTRSGDETSSEQERVDFANEIKADMLISVHCSFLQDEQSGKKSGLTAIYNGKYFIPDFGSIELANIISEETIKKVGGVANGMYEAGEEDQLVNGAHVPVALIEIDSIVTDNNKMSLTSDKKLKRIAEGISAGIIKAKEVLEQQDL